jgi:hypothetical protein
MNKTKDDMILTNSLLCMEPLDAVSDRLLAVR